MKVYEISGTTLSVALFTEVTNSKIELRVVNGGDREEIERRWVFSEPSFYDCWSRLVRENIQSFEFSKELLELMQAGTLEIEVALLNASLIPDTFPLLAAAHKTLVSKSRDSLTTRTLHSELVYNFSGSKHISESLKRCGISDDTSYILVARFGASDAEMNAVKTLIKGKEVDLEELEGRANQAQIQKHYKITGVELGISSLGDAITCRIASRDAL